MYTLHRQGDKPGFYGGLGCAREGSSRLREPGMWIAAVLLWRDFVRAMVDAGDSFLSCSLLAGAAALSA